jgi:hypothetical protein
MQILVNFNFYIILWINIQDVEYFVDSQRTYLIETFHNLTTKYCPQKTSYSFKMFIIRKTLFYLHFNENHSNSANTFKFREKIIKSVLSRWKNCRENCFVSNFLQ